MAKIKTKVQSKTTKKQSKTTNRCGDCIHHKRGPKKEGKDAKCSLLGVSEFVPAPSCYSPDTKKIINSKIPILQIAELTQNMSASELRILLHTLKDSASMKEKTEQRFVFGQEVYVNLGAGYLTHYFKGYIVSVHEGFIHLGSQLKKAKKTTYIKVPIKSCSVVTTKQFKKLAKQLIKQERVAQEPADYFRWKSVLMPEKMDSKGRVKMDTPTDIEMAKYLDSLDAPTIDNAPKPQEEKKKKKESKKFGSKTKLTDVYTEGKMYKMS